MSGRMCASCNHNKGHKKCGGCKYIYYCSIECQKNHWPQHKKECKKIRKQLKKCKPQNSKQAPSLASIMADNMKKQYEKENKKRRTPRIKVTKAINGIFKIKLLNEFLRNKQSNIRFDFQFDYKLQHDSDDTKWKTCNFSSVLLDSNGVFCVRVPLHLKGYHIKCRLRAQLITNDNDNYDLHDMKWFDFSKEYKVSIPSSLIGTEFDIGDIVRYKEENDYVLSWTEAEVIDKLKNGYLQLKEIQPKHVPSYLKIKAEPFLIHTSRVALTDNVNSRYLLDLSNLDLRMDKQLLLKLNDNIDTKHKMKTYTSLIDIYSKYASFWKILHSKHRSFYVLDVKISSIAKYVALHVMQYLFVVQEYEWKITNCIVNDKDGALECLECLRAYFIKRKIHETAIKNEVLKGSDIDGRFQICDLCSVSVDQFEFIYHCAAKMEDRHDICLICVYSLIQQSTELSDLLSNILREDINSDCVQLIVSFVVGKVVKIDCT